MQRRATTSATSSRRRRPADIVHLAPVRTAQLDRSWAAESLPALEQDSTNQETYQQGPARRTDDRNERCIARASHDSLPLALALHRRVRVEKGGRRRQ